MSSYFSFLYGLKIKNCANIDIRKNCEMTLHDLKITKAGVEVFPNEWFTKPKQELDQPKIKH